MRNLIQEYSIYARYFAPRGRERLLFLGEQISQRHLHFRDRLVGIIGDAGSGKSSLIKGMFPGLELTNDDDTLDPRKIMLVRDLGEALECGAHVAELRRLWVDPFRDPRMWTLDELQALLQRGGQRGLDACLLPLTVIIDRVARVVPEMARVSARHRLPKRLRVGCIGEPEAAA